MNTQAILLHILIFDNMPLNAKSVEYCTKIIYFDHLSVCLCETISFFIHWSFSMYGIIQYLKECLINIIKIDNIFLHDDILDHVLFPWYWKNLSWMGLYNFPLYNLNITWSKYKIFDLPVIFITQANFWQEHCKKCIRLLSIF